MRNEDEIAEVKNSVIEVKESVTELRKISDASLQRIEKLENH